MISFATAALILASAGGAYAVSYEGSRGANPLRGDAGSDVLAGGPGEDHLFGASGNDTIYTGAPAQSDKDSDEISCGDRPEDTVYLSGDQSTPVTISTATARTCFPTSCRY